MEADTHERQLTGSPVVAHYPIDHTGVKVHMLVQAGIEAVDERHSTDARGRLAHMDRTMFSTAPSRRMK